MKSKMQSLALIAALAVAGTASAALPKPRFEPLNKQRYETQKAKIAAEYKADRKLCDAMQGQKQDVCEAQAKGRQQALQAELEARYKPGPEAEQKAKNVTAEANFDVAKAKCQALKDKAKDHCIQEAKAAREAAIRQAKVEKVKETGGPFASGAAHRVPKSNAS